MTTGSLLARVAAPANIQLAWSAVLENDRDDGRLAPGVRSFAEHAVEALGDIAVSLVAGTYVSAPLHRFSITDPDGDQRHLHIPEVSDRIVERAIVQVANVVVEPLFSPWSFGYRPGLGVPDACRRLALRRDEGCTHVVRADVRNCFDSLDRARLARLLDGLLDDEQLVELIVSLMARPVRIDGRIVPTDRGVAQGGPLSPWLSNVYLHEFDVRLAGRGNPAIRYADDMAIPTVGLDEAEDALRYASVVAAELGLELNKEKTRLVTFAEGFAFLGEEFTAGYPPPDVSAPQEEPDRRVLYVAKDGAVVRSSKGQIIVSEDTENLLTVPSSNVGAIVLFGNVGLSAGARAFALANGVSVSFVSRRGQFQGWLQGAVLPSARTRREQYRQSGDLEFQLKIAQKFVAGKLANLSALLLRYGYRNKQLPMLDAARDLENFRNSALRSSSMPELLGWEGAASKAYFEVFGGLLPEAFRFTGRSRRPPLDPVNAALSFAYTLLTQAAVTAVAVSGLDPVAGFLHADHANRPSLALDLMEEFRPVVVDTVILELFHRKMLAADDFRHEADRGAVLLTERGRRTVITAIEERLLEVFGHPPAGHRVSYRRAKFIQARQIAAAVLSGEPDYIPVLWR